MALKLAIHGGLPARKQPIKPRVVLDNITRQRVELLLDAGYFSEWYGGPISREFEREFARYHGNAFAVAVNSGTSALHAAYVAAGIGCGDEVIVPAAAYVSAASAAVQQGAIPVICDIEPNTYTLDASDLERRITTKSRAVVPVHFWGAPADMEKICAIANHHNLMVIEDCGQGHGAMIGDTKVGMFGHLACYSFAPRKHISTGEGGLVLTRSASLAEKVRVVANKGKGEGWLDYRTLGFSYVMGEFEALIGLDGLRKLDDEIFARRTAAEIYREVLVGTGLELPTDPPWGRHVYFKVPIVLPPEKAWARDFIVKALEAENVSVRPPHPPLYDIPWLRSIITAGNSWHGETFPVAAEQLPRIFEVESGPMLPPEEARCSAAAVYKVWRYVSDST